MTTQNTMENCASCDQQGSDEHCLEHHDFAQGTQYAKCSDTLCSERYNGVDDVAQVNYYCTHCRDKGIEDVDAMPAKDTTMYWEKDAQKWRVSDDAGSERPYCTYCGSEQIEE